MVAIVGVVTGIVNWSLLVAAAVVVGSELAGDVAGSLCDARGVIDEDITICVVVNDVGPGGTTGDSVTAKSWDMDEVEAVDGTSLLVGVATRDPRSWDMDEAVEGATLLVGVATLLVGVATGDPVPVRSWVEEIEVVG